MELSIPNIETGVIIVLDKLGTKGIWKTDTTIILQEWSNFVSNIRECFQNNLEAKGYRCNWIAISDTLIISVIGESPNVILDVGKALSWVIEYGLMQGNYNLRGTMSYGEIIQVENYVIGKAIDEVAMSYESDQWIGISVTESAGRILDALGKDEIKVQDESIFRRYDIQTKIITDDKISYIEKNCWVVNWPLRSSMLGTCIKFSKTVDEIIEKIDKEILNLENPKHITKWQNTKDFLKFSS